MGGVGCTFRGGPTGGVNSEGTVSEDGVEAEAVDLSSGELPAPKEAWKLLVRDLDLGAAADLRDVGPVLDCICGTNLWRILGSFDESGELSFYFLDIVCAGCGAVAKAPTPEDMGQQSLFGDDDDDD